MQASVQILWPWRTALTDNEQELPQGDKAKLLSELAAKVFAHAVGS